MGRTGTAYSLVATDEVLQSISTLIIEIPYMIDMHLFLGKELQDTIPPGGSTPTDCLYGRIPQDALDMENEYIKAQLKLHIELVRF